MSKSEIEEIKQFRMEEYRRQYKAARQRITRMVNKGQPENWQSLADCAHSIRDHNLNRASEIIHMGFLAPYKHFQAEQLNPYAISAEAATAIMYGAGALVNLDGKKDQKFMWKDNGKNCGLAHKIGKVIALFAMIGQELTCARLAMPQRNASTGYGLSKIILDCAIERGLFDAGNRAAKASLKKIPFQNIAMSMQNYGGSLHDEVAKPLLTTFHAFLSVRHLRLVK